VTLLVTDFLRFWGQLVEKKGPFIEEIEKQFSPSAKYGVLVRSKYLEIPDIKFTDVVYRSDSFKPGCFYLRRCKLGRGTPTKWGKLGKRRVPKTGVDKLGAKGVSPS
jgi:hypothetical protein